MQNFKQVKRFLEVHGDSIGDFENNVITNIRLNGQDYRLIIHVDSENENIEILKVQEINLIENQWVKGIEVKEPSLENQMLLDLEEEAIKFQKYELLQAELFKPRGNTFSDSLPFSMD